MSDEFLPYGRPCLDGDDVEAVVDVLQGDWLTTGPTVDRFEAALADRCDASHARVLSSGTSALHAAYHAAGVGPGTEVVVPALTFSATANAAVYLGAEVRFADVDDATLTVDPGSVEELVTERTRAIAAVDFAGHPARLDALGEISEDCGATLVEDAAHSLGATDRGRPVGSIADMTCLSFHPVKVITTGEGGAVLTDDPDRADAVGTFRTHGMDHEEIDLPGSEVPGGWAYDIHDLGYNYRLSDIHCALGISQLEKLDGFLERRRGIARAYRERLADVEGVRLPPDADWVGHAYHLFAVRVPADRRRGIFEALREDGIGAQVHYIPVNMLSAYRERGHDPEETPRALQAYRELISLPCFPAMDEQDVDRVVSSLAGSLQEGGARQPPGR